MRAYVINIMTVLIIFPVILQTKRKLTQNIKTKKDKKNCKTVILHTKQ